MRILHIVSRMPSPVLIVVALSLYVLGLANAQDFPLTPPDDPPSRSSAPPSMNAAQKDLGLHALQKSDPPTSSALQSPGGGVWLAEGPGPATMGQVEGITLGPNEVVGAVHVIAAHPTDTNILYAGGTNGGLWKTTNALDPRPFWTPLIDDKASLSMGALEFDPTDGTNQTLVAGVGRYSSFFQTGGSRTGLLRTADGGLTWAEIDGSGALTGLNISGVAPRGSTILASVNDGDSFTCPGIGIWRSTDGGSSFNKLSVAAGVPDGSAFDLASNASSSTTFYTGITYGSFCTSSALPNGVYKSSNTGASWSKVSNAAMDALIVDGVTNNIEISAIGQNVYVNIIQTGRPVGIFYSADGGASFTAMDLPRTPEGSPLSIGTVTAGTPVTIDTTPTPHGLPGNAEEVQILGVTGPAINGIWTTTQTGDFTFTLDGSSDLTPWTPGTGTWQKVVGMSPKQKAASQGGIHASIVVDPFNPTMVAVGGDRQDGPFPNYLLAGDFTGRLFRGNTAVAATGAIPSPQWAHMTHSNAIATIPLGGTQNGTAPHADSREMVWSGNSHIIEGDDGGIYRREFAFSNAGDWVSINGNLQVTEQHDVAYDSISNIIISGNQDTGTTQQTVPHGLTWVSVTTADGGDVAVDDMTSPSISTRYSSFQNFGSFRRQEYNASNDFVSQAFPTLTPLGAMMPMEQFVTPVVLNANIPTRLLIGACNAIFESMDKGDTITEIAGLTGCPENAITYGGFSGGAPDPDTIWAAVDADLYQRVGAGGAFGLKTAYPGNTVTDIVVDPTDTSTAYVLDATHVYQTHDGGTSWTDITGNLSDSQLQSAAIDPGASARIFVGGRQGVFVLPLPTPGVAAGGPFAWTELGSGLANAPVWDMEWDGADEKLIVGTLGRGAWTLQEDGACGFPKSMVVNNRIVNASALFKACNSISAGPELTINATGPGAVHFAAGLSVSFANGTVIGGPGDVTVELDPNLISP
ncbi:MAG: WD40/YVTN/BNR-like repeat-containing protein [Woeseiaceae bacterium]